jgi:hypothetical protein
MNPFQNAKVIVPMGAAILLVLAFNLAAQQTTPLATTLRARATAAQKVVAQLEESMDQGFRPESAETIYVWSVRRLEAERAADPTRDVAILETHLALMRKLAERVEALVESLRLPSWEAAATEFYRAEAEAWLAQAKAK